VNVFWRVTEGKLAGESPPEPLEGVYRLCAGGGAAGCGDCEGYPLF